MDFSKNGQQKNVDVKISRFARPRGAEEIHIVISPRSNTGITHQIEAVETAYINALSNNNLDSSTTVFRRIFVSDYVNQRPVIENWSLASSTKKADSCAVSIIEQPPLTGKVVLWAYHILDHENGISKHFSDSGFMYHRHGLKHLWTTGLSGFEPDEHRDSYQQMQTIFDAYEQKIEAIDANLKDHVIRTWIYVQNVDNNYDGIVTARRELFEQRDMTPATHYIASTGIEGRSQFPKQLVTMDAYAIAGLKPEQVTFLKAPEFLNPTHEYGVTFERGTAIDFGDRRHIYISGTASINNKGQIVHENQIKKQTERSLTNIKALLKEADASFDDVVQMIVYIRDIGDRDVVKQYMDEHYPEIPRVLALAPVCRPGWLIEIECKAIIARSNQAFPLF